MRRLLIGFAILCLPMFACVVPLEQAQEIEEDDALLELVLEFAEDTSSVLTFDMSYPAKEEEEEDTGFEISCSEVFSELPGMSVTEGTSGGRDWCTIQLAFAGGADLQSYAIEELPIGEVFECATQQDGVFYFDLNTLHPFLDPRTYADEDPDDAGPMVRYPRAIPFSIVVPGPILTHNADSVDGNRLTWDFANPPSNMLINLKEGQPCPGQGVTLVMRAGAAGGISVEMVVALPPGADATVAESIAQRLRAEQWQVDAVGEPESGVSYIAVQQLPPGHVRFMEAIGQVPGLVSSSSDLVLDVAYGDAGPVRYDLELTLDMSRFADWWLDLLPDKPTPPLSALVYPYGLLDQASGDWASVEGPLVMVWDPASSPNLLVGRATSVPAAVEEATDNPTGLQAADKSEPLTVTIPITTDVNAGTFPPLAPLTTVVTTSIATGAGSGHAPPGVNAVESAISAPLCPEATLATGGGYNDLDLLMAGIRDPQSTELLVDGEWLAESFATAVTSYNESHPDEPTWLPRDGSPFGATFWVAAAPDMLDSNLQRQFVTGKELALFGAIAALQAQADPDFLLTPGNVFELALEATQGDVAAALLTAHNMLRSAAAAGSAAAADLQSALFGESLIPLQSGADNPDAWIRLFGMAWLETTVRVNPMLSLGAEPAQGSAALQLGSVLAELNRLVEGGATLDPYTLEQVEKLATRGIFWRPDDPQDYCLNVWGAQVGAELHRQFVLIAPETPGEQSSTFDPPEETTLSETEAGEPPVAAAVTRFLNVVDANVSIQWEDQSGRLIFDNGPEPFDGRLLGELAMNLIPVPADDGWQIAWFSPDDRAQTVTFESMQDDAPLRYARVDMQTGEARVYSTTIAAGGDQATVTYGGATSQPPLIDVSGNVILPETAILESLQGGPDDAVSHDSESGEIGYRRAVDVLESFRLEIERYEEYDGEYERGEWIEVLRDQAPGTFAYDLSTYWRIEDADTGESVRWHWLVGDVEAVADGEALDAWPRSGQSRDDLLIDVAQYEELGWAVASLPEIRSYGPDVVNEFDVEWFELDIDEPIQAPAPLEEYLLISADVGIASGGLLAYYELEIAGDDGGEVAYYYELSVPSGLEVTIPDEALQLLE